VKNKDGDIVPASFEEFEEAWKLEFNPEFYVYENWSGPASYVNKTVQEVYEPGSVFKPIIMASAIDSGEVSPSTTFNEDGPIKVGDFEIHTALDEYNGIQTMTNVLETSSNVGMAFVAMKLGKAVMYDYIKKFGFGEYTDIELENETEGQVMHYKKWSDALLITSSFGQGLSATPIQVATAWSALANGGLLIKPHIVAEIRQDGQIVEKIERQEIRRAISPETSSIITQMLVSSVDNGVAHSAKVPGHKIAGKTGTSQIANIHGRGYEDTKNEGSVITTFAGYAPVNKPKFVILVKFDRARVGQNAYGSTTAGPVFKEVASYLFEYYSIPPDEE
jgi:cell division protein FtsI/penicillin-binding protein 2